jgi:hypothetical protein
VDKQGYPGSILLVSIRDFFLTQRPYPDNPAILAQVCNFIRMGKPWSLFDALFFFFFFFLSLSPAAADAQSSETQRRVEQPLHQSIDTRQSARPADSGSVAW